MIDISNNSFATLFISTLILLIPTSLLLWILAFGHITLLQWIIVLCVLLGILVLNFWLNFLIFYIYYDVQSKQFVIKRLGKVVYKSKSYDISIKPMGLYAMSFSNFILLLDGRKFRFRSSYVKFSFTDWINKKNAAEKIRTNIMNLISGKK